MKNAIGIEGRQIGNHGRTGKKKDPGDINNGKEGEDKPHWVLGICYWY